jgi:hypothetical protein
VRELTHCDMLARHAVAALHPRSPHSPPSRHYLAPHASTPPSSRVPSVAHPRVSSQHHPRSTILTWLLLLMHVTRSTAACDYADGGWAKASPRGPAYNTATCLRDANVR